jgi:hypothetical protein
MGDRDCRRGYRLLGGSRREGLLCLASYRFFQDHHPLIEADQQV